MSKNKFIYCIKVVWPVQFVALFDSLIGICTLGCYIPSTTSRVINYLTYVYRYLPKD